MSITITFDEELDPKDFVMPLHPAVLEVANRILFQIGEDSTALERIEAVYNYVSEKIQYVEDKTQYGYEEVWAFPYETIERGMGDCEDSSFLMVSLLQALGIQARIATGESTLTQGQRHMWVVTDMGILDATANEPFSGFATADAYQEVGTGWLLPVVAALFLVLL